VLFLPCAILLLNGGFFLCNFVAKTLGKYCGVSLMLKD